MIRPTFEICFSHGKLKFPAGNDLRSDSLEIEQPVQAFESHLSTECKF